MNICIFGCGWLGLQLGEELLAEGYQVWGTTRNMEKIGKMEAVGISPVLIDSSIKPQISTEITDKIDVLILSMPPAFKERQDGYASYLGNILEQFKDSARVIFTSSIGVYPHRTGVYAEDYIFAEGEDSILSLAEKSCLAAKQKVTILRLGGLWGEDRHPVYHLQGRTNLDNPEGIVNLIHRKDIVRCIQLLIRQEYFENSIYNLVYPGNRRRKEYYQWAATHLGLSEPTFSNHSINERSISVEKIQNELKFSFTFDLEQLTGTNC